jgi:uncharacterized protein
MRPAIRLATALGLAVFGGSEIGRAAEPPKLAARVNDYAGLLSRDAAMRLEQVLEQYEQQTGHQFALLTIASLDGDPIEDFSIRVAEAWKTGAKGRDDGLIFIVAKAEHKTRIEVGYGLEGAVPDALAKRILDDYVRPHFQRGDFGGGIFAGFGELMHAASGESLGPPPTTHAPPRGRAGGLASVILPIIILILLRLVLGPNFWWLLFLGGSRGGYRGGGGSGGFSGGGGSFGGGGASGDW